MADKKKNKSGLMLACWFLLGIILLIVFLVNKNTIIQNLKDARFFERVTGKTPQFIENFEAPPKKTESNGKVELQIEPGEAETSPSRENDLSLTSNSVELQIKKKEEPETKPEEKTDTVVKPESPKETEKKETVTKTEETKTPEKKEPAVPMTSVKLYFVVVESNGSVTRKQVIREIPKSDSPLTNTIRALLAGTSSAEKNCRTLIPAGTRLLGASVKNGIATLNLSEEFEYNQYGADGYRAQLMQLVYTATEFSTVDSVQFLVEGQRKNYIGSGEDVWMWIGSPYSRSSF